MEQIGAVSYDAQIERYKECSRLLKVLDENNDVYVGLVSRFAGGPQYSEHAVDELISVGAARRGDSSNIIITESTHSLNVRGYFEERIKELVRQKRLEELSERSVMSSEKSAHAAEESAKSAKYANVLSLIAIVVSVITLLIGVIIKF